MTDMMKSHKSVIVPMIRVDIQEQLFVHICCYSIYRLVVSSLDKYTKSTNSKKIDKQIDTRVALLWPRPCRSLAAVIGSPDSAIPRNYSNEQCFQDSCPEYCLISTPTDRSQQRLNTEG